MANEVNSLKFSCAFTAGTLREKAMGVELDSLSHFMKAIFGEQLRADQASQGQVFTGLSFENDLLVGEVQVLCTKTSEFLAKVETTCKEALPDLGVGTAKPHVKAQFDPVWEPLSSRQNELQAAQEKTFKKVAALLHLFQQSFGANQFPQDQADSSISAKKWNALQIANAHFVHDALAEQWVKIPLTAARAEFILCCYEVQNFDLIEVSAWIANILAKKENVRNTRKLLAEKLTPLLKESDEANINKACKRGRQKLRDYSKSFENHKDEWLKADAWLAKILERLDAAETRCQNAIDIQSLQISDQQIRRNAAASHKELTNFAYYDKAPLVKAAHTKFGELRSAMEALAWQMNYLKLVVETRSVYYEWNAKLSAERVFTLDAPEI